MSPVAMVTNTRGELHVVGPRGYVQMSRIAYTIRPDGAIALPDRETLFLPAVNPTLPDPTLRQLWLLSFTSRIISVIGVAPCIGDTDYEDYEALVAEEAVHAWVRPLEGIGRLKPFYPLSKSQYGHIVYAADTVPSLASVVLSMSLLELNHPNS